MTKSATRIELAPNCSLSPRGARWFFGSCCVASFGIAGLLTLQGFWPVLPFAGLEMLLLGVALKLSLARRHQRQIILISADVVQIEDSDALRSRCVVFQRHWAQVRIRTGGSTLQPSRLLIESHGRRHEIGHFLNEQERLGLAERLRRLIGRMDESPPLPSPGSVV